MKGSALLLLPLLGILSGPPAWAAKNIEVDWPSGEVSIEEDAPPPEPPPSSECCPEADRLADVVRKQQVLLKRQQARIKELERDLDGQRRINVRLNQLLQGVTR